MIRPLGFDLCRWATGLVEVSVAIFLLLAPSQLVSPAYAYVRPHAGMYGLLLLIAGGQLVTLAATRPLADRRPSVLPHALASIPLFYLAYGYMLTGYSTGVVINVALGLGCLAGPLLVRQSGAHVASVTGDALFFVIALAQIVDGAILIAGWPGSLLFLGGAFSSYVDVVGIVLLAGGSLLLIAHSAPGVSRWFLGVAHVVAAIAFLLIFIGELSSTSARTELVHYVVLDVFLLAGPFLYGPPGLLRSDTLAVRLSALIALIAAVPLIFLSIVTSTNVRAVFEDLVGGNQLVLAKVSANRLADLLATSEREVDVVGDFEEIRSMDPSRQRAVLETVGHGLAQFTSVSTADLDGNEVARSDDQSLGFVGNFAFFQTARSGYVTWQYLAPRSTRGPSIVFAAPIRGMDERVNGVVFGTIMLPGLAETIDENALESGSRVFLLDDAGGIVASSGDRIAGVQQIGDLLTDDGTASFTLQGKSYLAGVATVKPQNWRVVVAIPEPIALATIDRAQRITLITFVIAILGALLAAGSVARLLARPISQLTAAAEALAHGDDQAPVPVGIGGEVGVLANSFDSMRCTLQAQSAALLARERRARGVASVIVAVENSHGYDEALAALCRELRAELGCSICVAYLEEHGSLVPHAWSAEDSKYLDDCRKTLPAGAQSLVPDVFRTGIPSVVTEGEAEARVGQRIAGSLDSKAAMAVPVMDGGARTGVLLAIDTARADRFGPSELDLARAVVDTADLVLENARLDEENDRRRIMAERLAALNADLYWSERATADALRESQAEMERFVYTVSHDLRAPLVTIQGFTHRVLDRYGERLDDRGRDYLARVERNAQRLEALINDLLQLARIGRTDVDVQNVNVRELAEEVRGELALQLEAKGIDYLVVGDPPVVLANRYRLGQVLANLVENAILYMDGSALQRRPTISIGASETPDGWKLWVADNGVGIPSEHRERVFNVFERLAAGKAAHPQGTGIGLATVRKIVENHGGRVWIDETPGGGATIAFTIVRGWNTAQMTVERRSTPNVF